MAIISNLTNGKTEILKEVLQNFPPELLSNITTLITILKALGIVIIIYLIFLIIGSILEIRRSLMIKEILETLKEINKKINFPKKRK